MGDINKIQEIDSIVAASITKLDELGVHFSQTIENILLQRNIFTNRQEVSNLAALNAYNNNISSKEIIEGANKNIEKVKETHPEIAEIYAHFRDFMSDPQKVAARREYLQDRLFDKDQVNHYLVVIKEVVKEFIQSMKERIQSAGDLRKINLGDRTVDAQKVIEKAKEIEKMPLSIHSAIATIIAGIYMENAENPKSDFSEKGLDSITNALMKSVE